MLMLIASHFTVNPMAAKRASPPGSQGVLLSLREKSISFLTWSEDIPELGTSPPTQGSGDRLRSQPHLGTNEEAR